MKRAYPSLLRSKYGFDFIVCHPFPNQEGWQVNVNQHGKYQADTNANAGEIAIPFHAIILGDVRLLKQAI
jgi:hypothetical protein